MRILNILQVGENFSYGWPLESELFRHWIDYPACDEDGGHTVKVGYTKRKVYGGERERVIVWIDGHPQVEFFGADDFESTGEVLSEIRIHHNKGEKMCRYPSDSIPERYSHFTSIGLPTRVKGKGVHRAWAVLANISDHQSMIILAFLRRKERR